MKYVPAGLVEEWAGKDPLARYERFLIGRGFAEPADLQAVVAGLEQQLEADLAWAEASPFPEPETAITPGVYGDREVRPPVPPLVLEWQRAKGRA
jgi:TPP-dependent pyruvate/acetoin dehydrogenase alpha subunit